MFHRIDRRGAAALALFGALVLSDSARAEGEIPDAWITTKVKMSLLTTEGAPTRDVDVDTVDGRVTLHGNATTEAGKAKAESVAQNVKGVRDVRNLIQVVSLPAREEAKIADDALKTRVSEALAKDQALVGSKIEVASTHGGVVLLSGSAPTLSEHRRALQTVAMVPGVRRVESEIQSPDSLTDAEIGPDGKVDASTYARSSAADAWITTAAKVRLLANPETPATEMNVDTENGVVTLFGTVPSEQSKRAATEEVKKVEGVREVRNALQIVPSSAKEMVKEQDADVKSAIAQKLSERTDLGDSSITIEVQKGIARLTGTVSSQSDRLVALRLARSTAGVRGVIDDLRFQAPSVSSR
jgi:osmotically-inducible protein OsmY